MQVLWASERRSVNTLLEGTATLVSSVSESVSSLVDAFDPPDGYMIDAWALYGDWQQIGQDLARAFGRVRALGPERFRVAETVRRSGSAA